jgi:hypothetical protein
MRTAAIRIVMVVAILVGPAFAVAAPPARPLPMTSAQFQAVCQLEAQPDHTAVLDLRASYTSEHEAMMAANQVTNDVTTGVTQTVWAGTPILLILLALPF